ncbi:hypothetical protein CDL15_Pgr027406 [Punica granatum]|uniref:Uncharacterized protein n=1 Tax=Punica granatum TaxID=22663 RepID=A0A218Y251_PUNGR|nr:hypothetical protein CDL15_Pgr027406 [Punica granatum]
MGVMRSGRVYVNLETAGKGKAPVATFGAVLEAAPIPPKKVYEEEAEYQHCILVHRLQRRVAIATGTMTRQA